MKKIIIIGAGISGLCAGIFLQKHGYETEIYEMHDKSGGLCTSWERNNFTFSACISWFIGSGPNSELYSLWNEIVDLTKLEFVNYDEYLILKDNISNPKNPKELRIYSNIDRLETELLEKAPEDTIIIIELITALRKLQNMKFFNDKDPELFNLWDNIKFFVKNMPYLGILQKYSKMSHLELSQKIKNPLFKSAVLLLFLPDFPIIFSLITLIYLNKKSAGYPIGGSLAFAQLLESNYKKIGGKINFNSRVSKIKVKDNRACGITLNNSASYDADIIISAADGYDTLYNMLEKKYLDNFTQNIYNSYKVFPSLLIVSLGVSRTFDFNSTLISFVFDKEIKVDDQTESDFILRVFSFDPKLAPKNSTSLMAFYTTYNYEYWVNLKEHNPEKYKEEKNRIANDTIEILEKNLGNIKEHIEVIDVSTPASIKRYTNNWKCSFEGWQMRTEKAFDNIPKKLKNLNNFYHIGQ